MDNIIEPDNNFNFNNISLGIPNSIIGGSYFVKLFNNNKTLYIQTPKSLTKQGFIKNGKKIYCDLMFSNEDTIFIEWLENIEQKCCNLIYEKSNIWFENKMDLQDIENAFTTPIKIYKSGKYYLFRVNINPSIKIYDEYYNHLNIENINIDNYIISILEVHGIKFTSKNFQLDFIMKQLMLVSPDPFLDNCFIKNPINKNNTIDKNNKEVKLQEIHNEEKDCKDHMTSQQKGESECFLSPESEHFLSTEDIIDINNKEQIKDLENILINFDISNKQTEKEAVVESPAFLSTNSLEEDRKPTIKFSNNIIIKPNDNNDYEDDKLTIHNEDNINDNIKINFDELDNNNIKIEFEELDDNIDINQLKEKENLKNKEKEIYNKLYKETILKAKELKKQYVLAYEEAKSIKDKYMLDCEDIDNDYDI